MTFRGQVAGWKASRRGEEAAPLLTDVPLYSVGALSSRVSPRVGTIFSIGENDVDTATIRLVSSSDLDWKAEPGGEPADRPWARTLRARQARYRRDHLGLPAGLHERRGTSRPVESRLPGWAVAEDPTLNFLADERIYEAVLKRLAKGGGGGIIEPHRLHHDLLSSQPLCFNLLALPALVDRTRLARALATLLELDVRSITDVKFEHRPVIDDGYSSGSAFDCYIEYKTSTGKTTFLGIETKYSEDLARQRPSNNDDYRALTEIPHSGWNQGASLRLKQPVTCQLWYNALLAERAGRQSSYESPTMVLLACAADQPAFAAAQAVAADAPQGLVRWASYDQLVTLLGKGARLESWAAHFATRYLEPCG
ncbi:MAG TPA: hypothetical protein VM143_14615 [Acidimicrobiales bacterium]|nr:hypothetical protein [Acidimicrobiales bacterium]